eukprot:jgi/Tetstr1/438511/TSEL_027066.t1
MTHAAIIVAVQRVLTSARTGQVDTYGLGEPLPPTASSKRMGALVISEFLEEEEEEEEEEEMMEEKQEPEGFRRTPAPMPNANGRPPPLARLVATPLAPS